MNGLATAFAISFGVVFVAELGDKSQLMALTFATRYRTLPVLVGITLATAAVHAVSVAIGYGLGAARRTPARVAGAVRAAVRPPAGERRPVARFRAARSRPVGTRAGLRRAGCESTGRTTRLVAPALLALLVTHGLRLPAPPGRNL